MTYIKITFFLYVLIGKDYDGTYTSFGYRLRSVSGGVTVGRSECFLLAGSDGHGNLYQVLNDTCLSVKPTICRKNIGK